MLHLVSTEARQELEAHLAPLREEQNHWPRQPRNTPEAHAVQELLDDIDIRSERLQVYTFPDSTRLSSTAPQAWGIFELDTHTRTTYLYISTKSHDFTGTVLHTYMSSRRCTRMQCFLAEYELADLANSLSKEWGLPDRFQKDIDALCTENLAELLERLEQEPISDAPVLMAKLKVYCEEVLERKKEPGWWVEDEEQ
ncbi:hypothetical protein BKA66DRAFT_565254 [Pyrenochaeta sp. MPI-SDFR-AT-0127]|nr:hypothetical protein BKA66DRAFT_565254 [Pyrenochaeta sp. MPI-SDFR-AT-0127]